VSSVFQHQRKPMSSAFQLQREIRVSVVINIGQLHPLSLHLMGNKSQLWRDLRGQLDPKSSINSCCTTEEKTLSVGGEKIERKEKTLYNLLSTSLLLISLRFQPLFKFYTLFSELSMRARRSNEL